MGMNHNWLRISRVLHCLGMVGKKDRDTVLTWTKKSGAWCNNVGDVACDLYNLTELNNRPSYTLHCIGLGFVRIITIKNTLVPHIRIRSRAQGHCTIFINFQLGTPCCTFWGGTKSFDAVLRVDAQGVSWSCTFKSALACTCSSWIESVRFLGLEVARPFRIPWTVSGHCWLSASVKPQEHSSASQE